MTRAPERQHETASEATRHLPVPDLNTLSTQQVRGTACVWCGVTLAPATAVDLTPRRVRRLDWHHTIFPRGCRTCMSTQTQKAADSHAGMCESCVDHAFADGAPPCDTAQTLRRLVLEYTR